MINRLGVAAPAADARDLVRLATVAEQAGVQTYWIGLHDGDPVDSSYLMVAAAGAAAVTSRIRIGVALHDIESALRLVEDAAVVDLLSVGRLQLALIATSAEMPPEWTNRVRLIGAPERGVALDDGVRLPITPASYQPRVPLFTQAFPAELTQEIGAGCVVLAESSDAATIASERGTLLVTDVDGDALPRDPGWDKTALARLRHHAGAVAAEEIVFRCAGVDAFGELAAAVRRVFGPGLLCAEHEFAGLIEDVLHAYLSSERFESARDRRESTR